MAGIPITNGFRVFVGPDGETNLDQILDGRVFPLIPNAEDHRRQLGYYDADFKLVQKEGLPAGLVRNE